MGDILTTAPSTLSLLSILAMSYIIGWQEGNGGSLREEWGRHGARVYTSLKSAISLMHEPFTCQSNRIRLLPCRVMHDLTQDTKSFWSLVSYPKQICSPHFSGLWALITLILISAAQWYRKAEGWGRVEVSPPLDLWKQRTCKLEASQGRERFL